MKKINYVLIVIILVLQFIYLRPGLQCWDWNSSYHFSLYDVKLQVDAAIRADKNVPILFTRAMHNKATYLVLDIFKRLMLFMDFRFLVSYLLPAGLFGLMTAVFLIIKEKLLRNNWLDFWVVLLFYSLGVRLFEIIISPNFSFVLKLILMVLPQLILAAYGIYRQLKEKKYWLVIVLILISGLWIKVFPKEILNFCLV
jgi:hypothetical protein